MRWALQHSLAFIQDLTRFQTLHAVSGLQEVNKSGLNVSWGVPFVLAAVAMVLAGVIIGFRTVKGEWRLLLQSQHCLTFVKQLNHAMVTGCLEVIAFLL